MQKVPGFGQDIAFSASDVHDSRMHNDDLVSQVASSTGLSQAVVARVIADVVAYYDEPVEDFVRRRHAHLKTYGEKNPAIFAQIGTELNARVVAAPPLSERQLRRIVYG